jgi:predicted RNase H-like nuclease (RuvC/YqgF family)
MKSLSSFLKFRQKEIDLLQNEIRSEKNKIDLLQNENKSKQKEIDSLRKENKLLKDAVYPLTSSGIPLEKLADVLKQIAGTVPKSDIDINLLHASYHDSGTALASNANIRSDKTLGSDKTLDDLVKDLLDSRKNIRFPPISEK